MNLFNYLMAKKGHNTSVRDDLLAYLLGKRTPKEVKTATGTTISITDATREKIVSLTLSKESTQDGTPSPENPVEVKTVKGNVGITITDGTNTRNYTIPLGNNEIAGIGDYKDELIVDKNGKCWLNKKIVKKQLVSTANITNPSSGLFMYYNSTQSINNYLIGGLCNFFKFKNDERITDNATALSYLNDNEMAFRLGSTKDRTYIKSNNFNSVTDFKSFLNDNEVILYYALETPQLIDLNYTVDIELFKGINNISNSDDMDMTLKYY